VTPPRLAAHLIVGLYPEPFLSALLESLTGAADALIVNDNSAEPSPHAQALQASWFGRNGRLLVDRTPFTDFGTARNICLDLHRKAGAGDWAAFVDADEVHGEAVRRIARNVHGLPDRYDFVDGYTQHFFQSFDLYWSIDRRMAFFRVRPGVRWEGRVHEHLHGLSGTRIALPYVYAHYGQAVPARRHAEKGRQYASLGQEGVTAPEERLDALDPADYFKLYWPHLLRFQGEHPPAARATITALRRANERELAQAEALWRSAQTPPVRLRNVLRKLNYEQRWRLRALNPRARELLR